MPTTARGWLPHTLHRPPSFSSRLVANSFFFCLVPLRKMGPYEKPRTKAQTAKPAYSGMRSTARTRR